MRCVGGENTDCRGQGNRQWNSSKDLVKRKKIPGGYNNGRGISRETSSRGYSVAALVVPWRRILHTTLLRVLRICLSAGAISLILAGAVGLRNVNDTTVALLLVLIVLGIALRWGSLEALAAAIAAALGLDYFVLPPDGFGMNSPEHWVAFFTFLVTALVTGQLSARAKRQEVEAVQRRKEIERLQRISDVLSECTSREAIVCRLGGLLEEIPELNAFAIYDRQSDRTLRFGSGRVPISEVQLQRAASSGIAIDDPKSSLFFVPIRENNQVVGSIGISAGVSGRFLKAVAEIVELAIARTWNSRQAMELEIGRRSEDLKSAVFDALAHDARGPLGSIVLAATTLLSERPGNPEQQREMLSIVLEEARRISRWVDEAARTSRIDAGKFTLNKVPCDVAGLVRSALNSVGPRLSGRRIDIGIPESFPMADCDEEMIQLVLNLLLDNALKYSPSGSPIEISSCLKNGTIVVTVADEGPGVPVDERELIFEKQYRGMHNLSNIPGTGLGLASAKCLVEAHGGTIWVTNKPSGGAEFHFTLLVAEGAA
jgi:two-component system sensor histidine kinase KdpD